MQELKENLVFKQEFESNDTINLRDELGKYLMHWNKDDNNFNQTIFKKIVYYLISPCIF